MESLEEKPPHVTHTPAAMAAATEIHAQAKELMILARGKDQAAERWRRDDLHVGANLGKAARCHLQIGRAHV